MDSVQSAKVLKELGHPERLRVFQVLSDVGLEGITVGELRDRLEIKGSTLSNYLSNLVAVDLVIQTREGKSIRCVANYDTFDAVFCYIRSNCGKMPATY
ncbi:ArsR/SmtB family transcription factor [Ferrimonas lipolytica]|uniref:Helix-turn-helix transcriptional regulator n=1 Tax=Ferrimonas lipolytica TaxID=2724191 RepID=A0A6H1UDW3_9GAMM|nr:helix-turn-helix domain-containing protein [Ferrimonas lipolytica]QIZ77234.1 helix-turn-helix transcriptional regulator [Ferrimonas lipolytica]